MCSRVDEIDTTGKSPQEVAGIAGRIIPGRPEPPSRPGNFPRISSVVRLAGVAFY